MATLAVTNTFSAGTTIVAADMNQNFDDVEAFINTTPGVVQEDIIDAVGDIIHGDAADSVAKLAVGTNDHCLVADSSVSSVGLKWAVPTDTTKMPLAGGTFTGAVAAGSDGSGVDVTFHSDTAGDNMLWDASDEKLVITGTDGANALEVADGNVAITDDLTVTGNLTVTGTTTNHLTIENNSDAAIAPALGDENTYFVTTHATAVVTLPQDSAQAFAIGTVMYFERNGTGTLTFAAGTGATVTSKDSTLTCADRYTTVATVKVSADGWSLIGNIG